VDTLLLDSNQVIGEGYGRSRTFEVLLTHCAAGRVRLLIPELLMLETENKLRVELEGALPAARKAAGELRRLTVDVPELQRVEVDPVALAAQRMVELRARLTNAGAVFLPYPAVGHEAVVRREVERRPPLDERGNNSHRDTLLWELALERCVDTDLVLVSNDRTAFAESKSDVELNRELAAEALERSGRPRAIRLAASIGQALLHVDEITRVRVEQALFQEGYLAAEILQEAAALGGAPYITAPRGVAQSAIARSEVEFHDIGGLAVLAAVASPDGVITAELRADFGAHVWVWVEEDEQPPDPLGAFIREGYDYEGPMFMHWYHQLDADRVVDIVVRAVFQPELEHFDSLDLIEARVRSSQDAPAPWQLSFDEAR
jgi:hypothetical protein